MKKNEKKYGEYCVSYCECSGKEPVEFIRIKETKRYVIAKCQKCGKVEKFDYWVWYGIEPIDLEE